MPGTRVALKKTGGVLLHTAIPVRNQGTVLADRGLRLPHAIQGLRGRRNERQAGGIGNAICRTMSFHSAFPAALK